MKKVLVCIFMSILALFALSVSACEDENGGTYYPSVEQMRVNLEEKGYVLIVSVGERDGDGKGYVVDSLSATKGDDFIHFYWLENSADCEIYFDNLQSNHPDSTNFVLIENDEKWGNIVYCGTELAISDAGIRVVKVDVQVKV